MVVRASCERFEPRGNNALMHVLRDPVILLQGPAGTGKTLSGTWQDHIDCCRYPGARILWARQVRRTLAESTLVTFEEHVLPGYEGMVPSRATREHRHAYRYQNGSEIILGGFDEMGKVRGTEFDRVRVFQAEETEAHKVEETMRMLRHYVMPYQQIIFDVNPGRRTHYLNVWAETGQAVRLKTYHQDNPLLWDEDKEEWTPEGEEYLANLRRMKGDRYQRLYLGEWFSEEGVIYRYDPSRHKRSGVLEHKAGRWRIRDEGMPDIWLEWFVVGVDWGDSAPGTLTVYGFDRDQRMVVVEQYYERERTTEYWAGIAEEVYNKFRPIAYVCDHDRQRIGTFSERLGVYYGRDVGGSVVEAEKAVKAGISEVQERFDSDTLLILDGSLVTRDYTIDEGQPYDLETELEQWIWYRDPNSGLWTDKPDPRRADHSLDQLRYVAMWARNRDYSADVSFKPRSIRDRIKETG